MTIDAAGIRRVLDGARGRAVLLETEGLDLLAALGIDAPAHVFVRNSREAAAADTAALGGDRVVVKIISPASTLPSAARSSSGCGGPTTSGPS